MNENEFKECPKCGKSISGKAAKYCPYCAEPLGKQGNGWNDERLEQEARLALLAHYSSKSTNQTILLLTLALAGVTYAQLIMNISEIRDYLLILGLGFTVYFIIRQMGRLMYWSAHAEGIMLVKLSELKDANTHIEAQSKRLKLPEKVQVKNDSALYDLELKATYLN